MNCEICAFNNPKCTVTGVIIQDNKILLLKRNEQPFKGGYDFPGGYVNSDESLEDALKRELYEELKVGVRSLTPIKIIFGTAAWNGKRFSIMSHCYLVAISGKIKLNKKENSDFKWLPLQKLNPLKIAFDSNKLLAKYIKINFTFDLDYVKKLIKQLDQNAVFNEQSLYQAVLNGYVAKKFVSKQLVGLGWIFARQTMLRRQAVVEDMIVDEKYRGRGYGEELLYKLIKWAKDNGMEMIELTSNPARLAANKLYQKAGFKLHPTNHYLFKV